MIFKMTITGTQVSFMKPPSAIQHRSNAVILNS